MILHFPEYYKEFKCIANECSDSCCSGWRKIQIDDVTYEKYQSIDDDYSKVILDNIKIIDGQYFFRLNEGNCPFLNEDKLCDIYINEGEEYLCTTCKTYPRFIYSDEDETYITMTMSCPEVARMIIDRNVPVKYYMCRDDKVYLESFLEEELLYFGVHDLWEKLSLIAMIPRDDIDYDGDFADVVYDAFKRVEGNDELRSEIICEFLTLFYRLSKDTKGYAFVREWIKKGIGSKDHNYEVKLDKISKAFNSYREYVEMGENDEIVYEFINFISYGLYRGQAAGFVGDEFLANYFTVIAAALSLFTIQGFYYENNKEIMSKEKRIELFHSYSKVFEHSEKMREKTWEKFENEGYIRAAVIVAILAPTTI